MKVTLFTSNQPRHLHLIRRLAEVADSLFICVEARPSWQAAGREPELRDYFSHVVAAEKKLFGGLHFLPPKISSLVLSWGDVSDLDLNVLSQAFESDLMIVYGASYIKGAIAESLVEKKALNIHMGIAPYYRGSASNFWAFYDDKPEFVGATIHRLGKSLDGGDVLYHVFPKAEVDDPFILGMKAVRAAHESLVEKIKDRSLERLIDQPIPQDLGRQIRYTRNIDFSAEVAAQYLRCPRNPEDIYRKLLSRDLSLFVRPEFH